MWLFSKDISNTFPYTKHGNGYNLVNGWICFNCTNTKGEEYSLFVNNKNDASVQNALKRMKTLKHPDILNYVASSESGKEISIVTERVQPLEAYLKERVDSTNIGGNLTFITSWGLTRVLRALSFLQDNCRLQHNYVCLASVFVTRGGDWRIGMLDFVTESGASVSGLPDTLTYPSDSCMVDQYGFGCFIWEVFNRRMQNSGDIKTSSGNVPAKLNKLMQKMTHQRSNFRLNLETVHKQLFTEGGFSDNFYVKTLQFLEEIQVQDQQDRISMLKDLINHVDSLPTDVISYKLIPAILILISSPISSNQNSSQSQTSISENTEQVCTVIDVLIKVTNRSQNYEKAESSSTQYYDSAYDKVCESLLRVYTNCAARQTRVALLSRLDDVIGILINQSNKKAKKMIDSDLFPAVITGLIDTNPVVRETTLKACLGLAKHISVSNLTDVLIKNVCGLMVKDEQGGIRTNSAVLLAKITPILLSHESGTVTNKKAALTLMMTSLLRVTRDPFQPARMACVCALDSLSLHNEPADLACKLLPCLSFLTLDPDRQVRQQTITTMRSVLDVLSKNSDQISTETSNSSEFNEKQSSTSTVSKWSDWVGLGTISSKILSSANKNTSSIDSTNKNTSSIDSTNKNTSSIDPTNKNTSSATLAYKDASNSPKQLLGQKVIDNKQESPISSITTAPKVKGAMNLTINKNTDETETNDWLNSIDDDDNDDFFRQSKTSMKSSLVATKRINKKPELQKYKATPPIQMKSTNRKQEPINHVQDDDEEDGWGNVDW